MAICRQLLLHCRQYRPSMAIKKTPPWFPGAGFLEFVWLLLRRALTRTSVGNEKYEYEDENRKLARADE